VHTISDGESLKRIETRCEGDEVSALKQQISVCFVDAPNRTLWSPS